MAQHSDLHVLVFTEPMFQQNALLLWPRAADAPAGEPAEAWIIDPGLPPTPRNLTQKIAHLGVRPRRIVLTHCHIDHIAGIDAVMAAVPDLRISAPAAEAEMLTDPDLNLSAGAGFPISAPPADDLLEPGATLRLGPLEWRVLDVAGHSPGGLAFYCPAAGVVIGGDALFAGSIGRYDFPGSSGRLLIANIRRNLLTLPDETVLYSGHGPTTTIGRERLTNPYLQPDFEPEC